MPSMDVTRGTELQQRQIVLEAAGRAGQNTARFTLIKLSQRAHKGQLTGVDAT